MCVREKDREGERERERERTRREKKSVGFALRVGARESENASSDRLYTKNHITSIMSNPSQTLSGLSERDRESDREREQQRHELGMEEE